MPHALTYSNIFDTITRDEIPYLAPISTAKSSPFVKKKKKKAMIDIRAHHSPNTRLVKLVKPQECICIPELASVSQENLQQKKKKKNPPTRMA